MKKLFPILLLLSIGCKEQYIPPVHSTNNTYLVVEGFINNGQDSTYITLSHTFTLNDTGVVRPELHALLTVEGKDNSVYPLQEWGNGQYGAVSLALNNALQYRLRIRTTAGKTYLSDFVDLKTSPPIDSINWKRTRDGVQIYANTHDPQSASHYYRWNWQETWQFHSVYFATLQWLNDQLYPLDSNPYYTCWDYAASTSILVSSSTKLTKDVIYEYPIELIPSGSWLISVRYSILVKQYVLSEDAYNFWQNMQRNTEQIGSIFSPQPSAARGNIHNVADSSEQVIGFLSAGTLQKQRIFITPDQIPNWEIGTYEICDEFDSPLDSLYFYLHAGYNLPVDQSTSGPPGALRVNLSANTCVKCTLIGTNIKPSYWP